MSGFVKAGFSFLKNIGKGKTSPTIKSLKPNVPKTKFQKENRDLKLSVNKMKGSGAKLKQTLFEIKQLNKKRR